MSTRTRVLGTAIVLTALVAAVSAQAGPRARTHDGFFLRLSAGGGYAQTTIDDAFDRLKLSGASGDLNFAIGGAVGENLIVHGTLAGWSIDSPDVELNNLSGEARDASASLGGIGPGVTWYAMPANLYLSGSLLLTGFSIDGPGDNYESDPGVSIDLTVGKEWWVGNNWGLGLAGGVNIHSVPDDNSSENFNGTSFGLRFSATMN